MERGETVSERLQFRFHLLVNSVHIGMADARVPYVSWLVLQHHVDFRNQIRPLCMAGTLLEDARKATGEARATLLIDALGKMSELVYHPYLLALWRITCLAKEQWPISETLTNLPKPSYSTLVMAFNQRVAGSSPARLINSLNYSLAVFLRENAKEDQPLTTSRDRGDPTL
jgi:hypothetical protein